MYTQEEYFYGWMFYGAGALLLILCGWIITSRFPRELRQLLRLVGVVTLAVPWYADAGMEFLAPAWIIAAFEGIFDGNFWRAGGPLLSALAVALAIAIVWQVMARFLIRRD